jgi:hypothetical protein
VSYSMDLMMGTKGWDGSTVVTDWLHLVVLSVVATWRSVWLTMRWLTDERE